MSNEPDAPKSATVTFEKETAAKTALLLDNTQLGPSAVHVEAGQSLDDIAGPQEPGAGEESTKDEANKQDIDQEDKPRSRIIAEYLAHGYAISDQAIQKAIALDQKHGFSARFTAALSQFDSKVHATDRAKELDSKYNITSQAQQGWRGLHSYFERALDTPTGRKVRDFYLKTDKQVRDIHAEARRLADLKAGKRSPTPPAQGESSSASAPATTQDAPAPAVSASADHTAATTTAEAKETAA